MADATTFYSLGFQPEHAGDGRVHRLRVEVRAPHHQVRHRQQYLDVPREDRINEESFVVAVELPPGDATVVVGLRDGLGGEISYLRAELRVVGGPPPTPGGGR